MGLTASLPSAAPKQVDAYPLKQWTQSCAAGREVLANTVHAWLRNSGAWTPQVAEAVCATWAQQVRDEDADQAWLIAKLVARQNTRVFESETLMALHRANTDAFERTAWALLAVHGADPLARTVLCDLLRDIACVRVLERSDTRGEHYNVAVANSLNASDPSVAACLAAYAPMGLDGVAGYVLFSLQKMECERSTEDERSRAARAARLMRTLTLAPDALSPKPQNIHTFAKVVHSYAKDPDIVADVCTVLEQFTVTERNRAYITSSLEYWKPILVEGPEDWPHALRLRMHRAFAKLADGAADPAAANNADANVSGQLTFGVPTTNETANALTALHDYARSQRHIHMHVFALTDGQSTHVRVVFSHGNAHTLGWLAEEVSRRFDTFDYSSHRLTER